MYFGVQSRYHRVREVCISGPHRQFLPPIFPQRPLIDVIVEMHHSRLLLPPLLFRQLTSGAYEEIKHYENLPHRICYPTPNHIVVSKETRTSRTAPRVFEVLQSA